MRFGAWNWGALRATLVKDKVQGISKIKCKASRINISEEAGQSLRRLEETMETTSNLVGSKASEDEVCLFLYLL